jgi:hypothetical protein
MAPLMAAKICGLMRLINPPLLFPSDSMTQGSGVRKKRC